MFVSPGPGWTLCGQEHPESIICPSRGDQRVMTFAMPSCESINPLVFGLACTRCGQEHPESIICPSRGAQSVITFAMPSAGLINPLVFTDGFLSAR